MINFIKDLYNEMKVRRNQFSLSREPIGTFVLRKLIKYELIDGIYDKTKEIGEK